MSTWHLVPLEYTSEQLAAKAQKDLDTLSAEHDKQRRRLQGLDATILSEAQLREKTEQLAAIIPGYTQNIQDAADKMGISLIPGFDELTRTASTLVGAMGQNGLTGAVWGAVNALRRLADPNADTLSSGGTTNREGETTGLGLLLGRP